MHDYSTSLKDISCYFPDLNENPPLKPKSPPPMTHSCWNYLVSSVYIVFVCSYSISMHMCTFGGIYICACVQCMYAYVQVCVVYTYMHMRVCVCSFANAFSCGGWRSMLVFFLHCFPPFWFCFPKCLIKVEAHQFCQTGLSESPQDLFVSAVLYWGDKHTTSGNHRSINSWQK